MRSPKKPSFIPKNFLKNYIIIQLFSVDAIAFSKKNSIFFDPENMKKITSKVAHNCPPTWCTGPETEIRYQQKPFNAGLGI